MKNEDLLKEIFPDSKSGILQTVTRPVSLHPSFQQSNNHPQPQLTADQRQEKQTGAPQVPTVTLSDYRVHPSYQKRRPHSIQIPQKQPSQLVQTNDRLGAIGTILDRQLPMNISSNQSHFRNPLLKSSRFLRVMEGVSHFIREIYKPILRPVFFVILIVIGVFLIGPAIGIVAL